MSNEWQIQISKFFVKIIELERNIENQRIVLASNPLFEPYSCFQRLDRDSKGYLLSSDFRNFLKDFNLKLDQNCLSDLVNIYDTDRDLALKYQEFVKLVLTYTDPELRSIATQRSPYKVRKTDFLSREIENELVRLFKLEFELIQEIYAKLESLKYIFGFDIRTSFEYMDKFRLNYLDENNLAEFITNNYKFVSAYETKMLLKRFDVDNDGKLGFGDYLFFMKLGKNNKLNNSTKLNRFNYSFPNFDTKIALDRSDNFSRYNCLNYDYNNEDNYKIVQGGDQRRNISYADNSNLYANLSYRPGEDPDIDTLRSNTSRINKNSGRKDCRLDNLTLLDDKNTFKTSLISYNPDRETPDIKKKNAEDSQIINQEIHDRQSPFRKDFQSRNNKPSKTTDFLFNRNESFQNNKIIEDQLKKSFLTNLNKSRDINESIFDLSHYNTIQDGMSGFILLIKEMIKLDSKLEIYKEKMANSDDIELNDIFKYFDKNYKGYFFFEEFKSGIFDLGINSDSNTINCVFKLIDRNNDNTISYNEFCEFLCPRSSESSAKFRNRVPSDEAEVTETSKSLIINFFRILIDNESRLENIKGLLVKKPSFNISELFQILRGKIKCFIVKKDFEEFLKMHEIFVNTEVLDLLMFRYDKNNDARITMEEVKIFF